MATIKLSISTAKERTWRMEWQGATCATWEVEWRGTTGDGMLQFSLRDRARPLSAGEYEQALEFYQKSLRIFERTGNAPEYFRTCFSMVIAYVASGRLREAVVYAGMAIWGFTKMNLPGTDQIVQWLAHVIRESGIPHEDFKIQMIMGESYVLRKQCNFF